MTPDVKLIRNCRDAHGFLSTLNAAQSLFEAINDGKSSGFS